MGLLETRKFISEHESSSQKLHCNVYIMQATFTPMVGHLQLHLKRYLIPHKSKILSSILMFSWFISLYSSAKVAINQIRHNIAYFCKLWVSREFWIALSAMMEILSALSYHYDLATLPNIPSRLSRCRFCL